MDFRAFQSQVYPLRDKLFRFARRMTGRTDEAEDVVQDAFIRLWNKRDRLAEYRSVEALAMITVKNLCLDRIKARKYPVENFDDHRRFLESIPEEKAPDRSDLLHGVKTAMRMLPEQQQMILHLRDIEGYEFEEIAEVMEMNENAVRVALSRARKRIRELILNKMSYAYQPD